MAEKLSYKELEQRVKELEKAANDRASSEKQQKFLLLAVNQSSEGIAVVDMNGNLEYLNNAFAEMHGYSVAELVGKNLSTFHTPEQMPYVEAANLELKQKDSFKGEIWHVRRDGTVFPTLMQNSIIRDKTNKPIGMMGTLRDITDRKFAENALRESEERYRTLFETMAQGVVYQNAEGKIISANPSAEKILGLSIDQMQGRTSADPQWKSIHEDGSNFRGETHPSIVALNTGQKVKDVIMGVFNPQTESYRWINIYAIPQFKEGEDSPCQVYTTFNDITDRKFAENALRENEERLLSIFRAAPIGIGVVIDRVLKKVNARLCEMTGYSEEELTGQNARMLYPNDEDYEYVGREKYEQIRDHGTGTVETRWKRKCGNIINILLSSTPMDLEDLSKGVTFTALDITDRKRIEEALISEKLVSEKYINSLPGLFYVFDGQRFVRWNSMWNRVTGYSDEELASMYGTDFFEGKDKMLIEKQMLKVFREGAAEAEAELVTKSGQRIPYYFNGLRKRLNGKDHLIGLGIDITDRKQAEEEKRKALEFTAEQNKHALIGQVTGKMAHDFNNVLMGIMGNAQLAVLDCDDEKTKKKLEWIIDFSERGRDITNSLLSFSKDQEPKQISFKIVDKIDLVLKMLDKDLTGIKVSRNYKSGIPELLADPGMIQDVLVNLVQNSIHAMSKVKNPTLNLRAYSQDNKVYFEIEDNGCGIPKEHQDSIYTPSFTLKGSHDKTGSYKSEIKGTGYGMSNVKKYIVEKHKGDIFLTSEVGKGTKITIALKVIKDHLSSDEKKEVMKSQTYDKRRILLVEDESAIADVQYQILTKEPFNHIVSTAVNGQMAIDVFDRNKFDVVSLDYMLPGKINGLDVYNHIREKDKNIPVLFISGNIEFLESMTKLREKDPNLDHLSKPVDNLDYVNKINELVGRSILITK